jgi:hypothetical protein
MIHAGKPDVNSGRALPTKIKYSIKTGGQQSRVLFSDRIQTEVTWCFAILAELIFEIQLTNPWEMFTDW